MIYRMDMAFLAACVFFVSQPSSAQTSTSQAVPKVGEGAAALSSVAQATSDLKASGGKGAGRLILSGSLLVQPNVRYAASSSSEALFFINDTASGSPPRETSLLNKIACNDSLDFVKHGGAAAAGNCLFVIDNLMSGATGGRSALNAQVNVLGELNTPDNFFSGATLGASSSFNVGGTDKQAAGNVVSFSFQTNLNSGATHYSVVEGFEGGVQLASGSSALYVNGGKIAMAGCGQLSCNGMAIEGVTGFPQATIGLSFGGAEAPAFPVSASGTLVGVQAYSGGNIRTFSHGVDLSNGECLADCYKSRGFFVDGYGRVSDTSEEIVGVPDPHITFKSSASGRSAEIGLLDGSNLIIDAPRNGVLYLNPLGSVLAIGGVVKFSFDGNGAAMGTGQKDATMIKNDITVITRAVPSSGVVLAMNLGGRQEIFNRGANVLLVYPPPGARIESNVEDLPVSLAVGGHAEFVCTSVAQCFESP